MDFEYFLLTECIIMDLWKRSLSNPTLLTSRKHSRTALFGTEYLTETHTIKPHKYESLLERGSKSIHFQTTNIAHTHTFS
jgi:hypothetical protein